MSGTDHEIDRKSIGVFCGARPGTRPEYTEGAKALGTALGRAGITLVYGGASVGLMGVLADAALNAGGKVVGVMPQYLVDKEIAHRGLSEFHIVGSMHERKALMATRSQAFIAMPGGFGTWDELFEVITWTQVGLHHKPAGLLNLAGYWDPMLKMIAHAVAEGFVPESHVRNVLADADPGSLVARLRTHDLGVQNTKWSGRPPA